MREDYAPTVTLAMIICGLIFILTYPNGEDALNPPIGDLMVKNKLGNLELYNAKKLEVLNSINALKAKV